MLDSPEPKVKRRSGGRPTQEEAARRDERLVEIAAQMFMERGFDATTIDAVAEAASVGKATLYARYKDKADLFAAVFKRQIDRWMALDDLCAPTPEGRVEDVLLALGRRMTRLVLTPESIAINRIVSAQAMRFPDLARLVHREGWQRSNRNVGMLLEHFVKAGQIQLDDLEIAADMFLSLVIGRHIKLAMLGIEVDAAQIDLRLVAAVRLFVRGCRVG